MHGYDYAHCTCREETQHYQDVGHSYCNCHGGRYSGKRRHHHGHGHDGSGHHHGHCHGDGRHQTCCQGPGHHGGCRCGGHGGEQMGIKRRYISPEEKREMLENYIEQLKKELAGAEAALKAFDTEE